MRKVEFFNNFNNYCFGIFQLYCFYLRIDGSLHALVTIFHTIDKDDSGLIDLEELKAFILKEKSKGMKKKQVDDGDIDALDMFVVIAALGAAAIGAFYFLKARKHI